MAGARWVLGEEFDRQPEVAIQEGKGKDMKTRGVPVNAAFTIVVQ